MRIGVVGSGYVGLVAGACFADLGHDVILVDNDQQKLALRRGRHLATVPPGLTTRVWTGPKEGAVKVANTHGCAASDFHR